MIVFNTIISKHAIVRYHQRAESTDVKMFLKHLKDNCCVIIYECVKDGNIDGIARQYKFGKSRFIITFDTTRTKLVLKTII